MNLMAFLFLIPAVLVAPFGVWVYVRRSRWRRPENAVMYAYVGLLVLVLGLSAASSYFYPFGFPGRSAQAWRAAAHACAALYSMARTAGDSTVVDTVGANANAQGAPPCMVLRSAGLLEPSRQCLPDSRCGRVRSSLRLPEP